MPDNFIWVAIYFYMDRRELYRHSLPEDTFWTTSWVCSLLELVACNVSCSFSPIWFWQSTNQSKTEFANTPKWHGTGGLGFIQYRVDTVNHSTKGMCSPFASECFWCSISTVGTHHWHWNDATIRYKRTPVKAMLAMWVSIFHLLRFSSLNIATQDAIQKYEYLGKRRDQKLVLSDIPNLTLHYLLTMIFIRGEEITWCTRVSCLFG